MNAQTFSSEELRRRTLERRAVEAAIWGMPIVSMHAMREAFFRDAKAKYNDIVFWSNPAQSDLALMRSVSFFGPSLRPLDDPDLLPKFGVIVFNNAIPQSPSEAVDFFFFQLLSLRDRRKSCVPSETR